MDEQRTKWWAAGVILVLVLIVLVIIWMGVFLVNAQEVRLPILAIGGLIALLATLSLVSLSFAVANLSDKTQALGLPEGSIRAAIALSLVVLFAIVSIYLYGSLDGGLKALPNLTEVEANQLAKITPADGIRIVKVVPPLVAPKADANPSPAPGAGATPAAPEMRYTVYYREYPSQSTQEFAKQIMILIGTLLTSVASFYFGSRAAATPSTPEARQAPSLKNVDPKSVASGSGPQDLKIEGDGLDLIKEVKITNGTKQLIASGVTSSASVIKCKINVPGGSPTGAWDVVAIDGSGKQARLPGALTIT